MMNKAVIFDLDGTLIDSLGDIAAALNRLLDEENRPNLSLQQIEDLVGEGVNVLIDGAWNNTLSTDQNQHLVERYLALYLQDPTTKTVIYDGVPHMLKTLRAQGWHIGICTNKPDQITQKVLTQLDLAPLVDVVVGGDYPRRKPDGDHIQEVLRRLEAEAHTSLYVGDSGTDVAAARSAGIKIACVSFGYAHGPVAQLGADWIIDDFESLSGLLPGLARTDTFDP
jgi:phosphoglycolate phosphatase